ncbi:MAG TPA: GNAT family protein [Chloroflexia bacterium]|nr:GNAT family protein [Chloroflexia bacterium]
MDYLVAPEAIDTPAFTIRSDQPGDGALLQEAVNNSYEHLRTYTAWASPHQSLDESESVCRRARGRYLLAQDFTLGIFSPAGDRLLGGTGFHLRGEELALGNAEIGMWIRADAAGQGLGTAALVTMLGWGFDAWPWLRLEWHCDATNRASARAAQKAGMHQEAHLRRDMLAANSPERRDTLIFGALRGEWSPPAD